MLAVEIDQFQDLPCATSLCVGCRDARGRRESTVQRGGADEPHHVRRVVDGRNEVLCAFRPLKCIELANARSGRRQESSLIFHVRKHAEGEGRRGAPRFSGQRPAQQNFSTEVIVLVV